MFGWRLVRRGFADCHRRRFAWDVGGRVSGESPHARPLKQRKLIDINAVDRYFEELKKARGKRQIRSHQNLNENFSSYRHWRIENGWTNSPLPLRDAGVEVNGWHSDFASRGRLGRVIAAMDRLPRTWLSLLFTEQRAAYPRMFFSSSGVAKAMKKTILCFAGGEARGASPHSFFVSTVPSSKVESPQEAAEQIKQYAAQRMTTV